MNFAKIERELGWSPRISFDEGLLSTIEWYRQNQAWIESVRSGEYLRSYHTQYGSHVGSLAAAECASH